MADLKRIQEEMDAMSKALEEPSAGVDDPRTDAPTTDEPAVDAPATDAPIEDSKSVATDAPTTDAPVEDPRDKEIAELRAKLAEKESTPKETAPKTEAPSTEPPLSDENFVQDIDLDELTRDPSMLNEVLNKIYKKAVLDVRKEIRASSESVVRSIPDIVKNNLTLTDRLKKIHDEFYSNNKDLVPFKKVVGVVFEEMSSENPDRTYEELLPEVGKEVRRRLELRDAALQKEDNPPKLPRSKGSPRQTSKPSTDSLQQEFDAMDKALGLD